MSRILRWTTGVFSRFDELASRIENHDELVAAAIRDAREARARARVQLSRVQRDGERMGRRLAELEEAELRWKERALRVAPSDEHRALECLRRRRRAERERTALSEQLGEHERLERQLREDLGRVDERIEELSRQRNLLRTRQSRAEAIAVAQRDDGRFLSDIEDIFERWEVKVSAAELYGECAPRGVDELETEFASDEEADALRAELAGLLDDHEHGERQ